MFFSANASRIRIRLLGQSSIQNAEAANATIRSNRVPALLGLLLTTSGPQSREYAASLLWPDADTEKGRHNLRQTLLYLRQALGEDAELLDANRATIGLKPHEIIADVEALLATELYLEYDSKRNLCEKAVELYRGPFLAGLDEDWIRETRVRLATTYVRALIYLADAEMNANPAKALEYAERAIAEEPLLDGARARKVRALVRLGERAASQLEYEAFAALLDYELGMQPSEAVREALDDVSSPLPAAPFHHEAESGPSDIAFALESLSRGDRPHLAVSLAVALTPHWIEAGAPRQGITRLQDAVARSRDRLSELEQLEANVCLAELISAAGDLVKAGEILEGLSASEEIDEVLKVRCLLLETRLHLARIDGKRACQSAQAALERAARLRNPSLMLDTLNSFSAASLYEADFEGALAAIDRTLKMAVDLDEKMVIGIALYRKAEVLEGLDRHSEAESAVRQSLHCTEGIRSSRAAFNRMSAGRLLESLEFLEEAEAIYRGVLAEFQAFESKFGEVVALTYLGDLLHATGRPREAVDQHQRALAIRRPLHQTLGVATSLRGLGKALNDLNDLDEARAALIESAQLFLQEEALPGYASVLLARAHVEVKAGRLALAHRLARRAHHLLVGMPRHERKSIGRCGPGLVDEADALLRTQREVDSA